jgi:hypothetical protein
MKKRRRYTETPRSVIEALAASEPIEDFLPPPEKLIFKRPSIKVTLALSQESVEFFKEKAKRHQVPYQAMIREVVQRYAERYRKASWNH